MKFRHWRIFLLLALSFGGWSAWAQTQEEVLDIHKRAIRLNEQGMYAEALPLHQQVLAWMERTTGPDSANTAGAAFHLAGTLQAMGQYAKVEPLYLRALAITEKTQGPEHPETGARLNNLAVLYQYMGHHTKAELLYRRALAIAEKTLGPEHPGTTSCLNNLAALYESMGEYAKAEPLYRRTLAIAEKTLGPEHPETGMRLNNLAGQYQYMGQYAKAEPLYRRALNIAEKALGPEHPDTGVRLNNLALLHQYMGHYAKAEPAFLRALSIAEKTQGPEHPNTGLHLNNLAVLYKSMGQYAKAEPVLLHALDIAEKSQGPEHPDTGTRLSNLAALYRDMGQYAKAEPLYQRTLAIAEKTLGPEHPDTGTRLNNIALLYEDMGHYTKAEPLLLRALDIDEKSLGPEHPNTGLRLNNLAALYRAMGQYAKAEPLYRRALNIVEKILGPEHPDTSTRLNNIALLYQDMGHHAKAEPLYRRALNIAEKALGPEHPDTGVRLNNLAALYYAMGQYAKTEPLFLRALAIAEKTLDPGHPDIGLRLNNLAGLYEAMGQHAQAEPLALRAYRIALNAGSPDLLRHTQRTLSTLFEKQNKPEPAIFFGKQAVNTLQSLRSNVAGLGKETLKSFDSTVEGTYRHLSRLLIAESRLVEAERVLELLKEQEQFQYVRRDANAAPLSGRAPLTAFEADQDKRLRSAGAPLAKLYAEQTALEDKKTRSAGENARLSSLRNELSTAGDAFQKTLDQVLLALSGARKDKAEEIKEAQGLQNTLRELSEKLGESVVALYTVVDGAGYSLILTTPDYRRAYSVPVKAADLNGQILAWRETLKNPALDPRPQGKELLDILLPMAAREELAQAKATTLMWHLDGALRLLPLSALHDGQGYLMERYRLSTFTAASMANFKDDPKARWTALGLGVSEAREVEGLGFSALPSVTRELQTIIREGSGQGAIPGSRHLNQAFSWATMQEELKKKGRYPLIHIASHFHLTPGNDTMSFLLPGAGDPITLALITRQNNLFGGVDLLTLSACETAVGGGKNNDGVEVDGLSFIAQRQGAKAVMASLWPVADDSTALLMARFYSLREAQKLTKAEALRQAQLSLLTGKVVGAASASERKATIGKRGAAAAAGPAFSPPPGAPFAHPYYWAPFVLMGNWL